MATVVLGNPNDSAVDVRVLGEGGLFGLGKVNERVHVDASSSGSVTVPKGKYSIRYKFSDSPFVWEGDSFKLDADGAAAIILQASPDGNYAIRRVGGSL